MRLLTLLIFTGCICLSSQAQNLTSDRYQESIFSTQLTSDVQYGTAPQWIWPYWNVDLFLDVFEPVGDLNTNRPLIIFAHAGGFLNGSKEVDDMHALCDTFARKGFVTATIDYRKGYDPLDAESAERAVYRAIQDGKAAVRYFKENAAFYKIDTSDIFFGGASAGGFIAYHVAYLDKESERPVSTYGGGTVNDLGCLDCAGNNYQHTSEIKAVLDYWGGTIDTNFMEVGDVPILIMHGKQDPTVPYYQGYPFGLTTMPLVYGAGPIANQCIATGVPYQLVDNNMDIHMMDGSNNGDWDPVPNAFWGDTLLPFTTNFIRELIKPVTSPISSVSLSLFVGDSASLQVSNAGNSQYVWDYDAANVTALTSNNSAQEDFQFNTAGLYEIKVVEYNHLLAAGDTVVFEIEVIDDAGFDSFENQITLFPNPTNGQIFINGLDDEAYQLRLFDFSGQEVLYLESYEKMVELSHLPDGVYLVQINQASGVFRRKIVLGQ